MSRVAVMVFVGLWFLTGCKETSEPIKISVTTQTKPKTQEPDIFIVPDPNDQIALKDTVDDLVPSQNQFFIIPVEPQPGVDYKIIAVKPNPNIDYKILRPNYDYDQLMRQFRQRQLEKDNQNKLQKIQPHR